MTQMIFPVITDFDRKLPYFFEGVGVNYEQERIDRPEGHAHYQWIQTRKGEGILYLRGKEYLLKEGMGMFLFPGEPHTYHKTKEEWQVDWIIFEGVGIADFAGKVLELNHSEVGVVSEPERLRSKMEEVFQMAASDEPMKNSICSDIVYSLLMEILRKTTFQNEKTITGNQKKLDGVISHINRHYQTDLSLEELSVLVSVSVSVSIGKILFTPLLTSARKPLISQPTKEKLSEIVMSIPSKLFVSFFQVFITSFFSF